MSIINVELGNNRKTRDGKGIITQYDIAEELKKEAIQLPRCPRLRGNERTIQKKGCGNGRGELRRTKRKAVKDFGSNRWPGAIVNYDITGSFSKLMLWQFFHNHVRFLLVGATIYEILSHFQSELHLNLNTTHQLRDYTLSS